MRTFYSAIILISFLAFAKFSNGQQQTNTTVTQPDSPECNACKIASSNVKTLVYDFECKLFYFNGVILTNLDMLHLEKNEILNLHIKNVNRYIYQVEIDVEELKFISEAPPLFSKLILGEGMSISESQTPGLTEKQMTELQLLKSKINEVLVNLSERQIAALSVCEQEQPCCDYNKDIDFSALMTLINEYKTTFEKNTYTLKSKISAQKSLIEDLTKKNGKCTELTKLESEEKDTKKKTDLKQKMDELKCSESATKLIEANDELKKLEGELAEIEITSKDILSLKNEDIMKLTLFAKNHTAENYIYRMPIYFPSTSLTDLKIKISPLDTPVVALSPQMPLYNQSNSISVFQKGHWNVGFSTGPFFTIGQSLSDQSYVWKNKVESTALGNDTTVLKLLKNDKRNRFMGLASTLNLNCQKTRSFSYGLSFGAGISIEDKPRQNYLGGINVAFGMDHPFVISAGILTTRVDRFNEIIYDDPNQNFKEKVEIEYNKIWTTGGYFMVSYSLVKRDINKIGSNK
jgi:hypothetical protein